MFHFFESELEHETGDRKSYIDFIARQPQTSGQDSILAFFDQLTGLIREPVPGASFLIRGLICRILWTLGDKDRYTTIPLELGSEKESRIFAGISALLEQYNGRISREDLSCELNENPNPPAMLGRIE